MLVKHVAEPEEIAEAYLFVMKYVFLRFDMIVGLSINHFVFRCQFVTGQRIEVDGGYKLL